MGKGRGLWANLPFLLPPSAQRHGGDWPAARVRARAAWGSATAGGGGKNGEEGERNPFPSSPRADLEQGGLATARGGGEERRRRCRCWASREVEEAGGEAWWRWSGAGGLRLGPIYVPARGGGRWAAGGTESFD